MNFSMSCIGKIYLNKVNHHTGIHQRHKNFRQNDNLLQWKIYILLLHLTFICLFIFFGWFLFISYLQDSVPGDRTFTDRHGRRVKGSTAQGGGLTVNVRQDEENKGRTDDSVPRTKREGPRGENPGGTPRFLSRPSLVTYVFLVCFCTFSKGT